MRRKGFVYTLYTLLVLNLLLATMLLPMETSSAEDRSLKTGIDELGYFMQSFLDDMERGADISGRRALVGALSHVIDTGETFESSDEAIKELFINGTVEGNSSSVMNGNSFSEWVGRMEEQSDEEGYSFQFSVEELGPVESEGFEVIISMNYSYTINDTMNDVGFIRDGQKSEFRIGSEGLDEPLVLLETGGKYSNIMERCGFEPVLFEGSGDEHEYNYTDDGSERSWVSGISAYYSGDDLSAVGSRDEKILFTEDLCDYEPELLDDFGGVVSESTTDGRDVCGSGEEINGYIGGFDSVSEIEEGAVHVMDGNDVWMNRMSEIVDRRCYIEDDLAPGFTERLESDLQGDGGFSTLLDVPSLPPENQYSNRSAVDYKYFEGMTSDRRIKGVSDRQGYSWFRLDSEHVSFWNISELVY